MSVGVLVEHLFRRESGRITAALTRAMGARYLELAEEATQEALIKALQVWPFGGVPPEPAGWLFRTARNFAWDQLRRRSVGQEKERFAAEFVLVEGGADGMDDTLAMMLLCCHPAIPEEGRLALTLKAVSGFSSREIAAAFLVSEETIAQRIVRAKRRIREAGLVIEMPSGVELEERLEPVCEVLYLMFNEGYFASGGATALRRDLCLEAVRLVDCLFAAGHESPDRQALLALFHLHLARMEARVGPDGQLLEFDAMEPARFDAVHLVQADFALRAAMQAQRLSAWHLEAAIVAAHCRVTCDWALVALLYESLAVLKPTPVVALNRAVAMFRAGRRLEALAALDELEKKESLRGYYLLPATQARLQEEAGNYAVAVSAYRRALECRLNEPAREFLTRRAFACGGLAPSP